MFRRTAGGLSAEHRFYNVDWMLYSEGKEHNKESPAIRGDEFFWEATATANGFKIKCKCLGSKTNVLPLATEVARGNIENVLIGMDRDYGDFLGETIDHPRIIYTLGYSWESDVVSDFSFPIVLHVVSGIAHTAAIEQAFQDFKTSQARVAKKLLRFDIKCKREAVKFFDRERPASLISPAKGGRHPELNRSLAVSLMRRVDASARTAIRVALTDETCALRQFFGKTIAKLFYDWFMHIPKTIGKSTNMNFDTFLRVLIAHTDFSSDSNPIGVYYSRRYGSLVSAPNPPPASSD